MRTPTTGLKSLESKILRNHWIGDTSDVFGTDVSPCLSSRKISPYDLY